MEPTGRGDAGQRPQPMIVVLDELGQEVGTTSLVQLGSPDLDAVDAVARLRLVARRQGWDLRVRGACSRLTTLLDLVGMADLLEDDPGQSSR